jgi:hypothetical protein
LYDRDWKDAACRRTGKSFTALAAGNDAWQPIGLASDIPAHDDCGETTADDAWSVYLYTYHPVEDGSPVFYDDVRLARADVPDKNLVVNAGFEDGFASWSHSSYIERDTLVSTTDVGDDAWHTVGLVYDPPLARLFVDGREEDELRVNLRPFARFGTYTVGSQSTSGRSHNYVGLIEDLIVADRALSAQQVAGFARDGGWTLAHDGDAACIVRRDGATFTATRMWTAHLPQCAGRR